MFRAAWTILRGGEIQGGSTITQQYIKIMYLNSEQTVTRKFRELFLAYKINKELSKEEILTDYLNTIYFGRGAYGIQAAAQAYFDVDAEDLTTQQAAVLVSVINNPSLFDPGVSEDNIPRLTERYTYVLTSMAETGAITTAEATEYSAELPEFPDVKINERYGGPKGFLLKMVEAELVEAGFEPSQISGGGLKITTTFDKTVAERGGRGRPGLHQAGRRRTRQEGLRPACRDRLGGGRQRGGARSLRRSRTTSRAPATGPPLPDRPHRRSRRTRWPPDSTTSSA